MKNNFMESGLSVKKIRRLVMDRCMHVGTPRALTVYLLLKYDEDEQYVNLGIDPMNYTSHVSFAPDYEVTELLRKFDSLNLSWDPEERARTAFLLAEEQCRVTNRRLNRDFPTGRTNSIIELARKMISSLLGDVSESVIYKTLDYAGFGKGVTSSCKGIWLSPIHKFASEMQHTPALTNLVDPFKKEIPFGDQLTFSEVIGSRISYVPKDARTHRPICIEPQLNGYLQKGVGQILRRKLLNWGIDLLDQSINQRLARLGSLSGDLATIDLKAASDTISYETVRLMLPTDWFTYLCSLRCSRYSEDGKTWKKFHKFSSMGNGFTFELESMIFSSLVLATRVIEGDSHDYSVYGDDIIISTDCVDALGTCLEFLGFTVNTEKSFTTGPFRESCGADFYNGFEVRPFYIKKASIVTPYNWANWLLYNSHRLLNSRRSWSYIFSSIPERFRFRVPRDSGLLGFEVDWLDAYISNPRPDTVKGLYFKPRTRPIDGEDVFAAVSSIFRLRTKPQLSYPYDIPADYRDTARGAGKWQVRQVRVNTWPECPLV